MHQTITLTTEHDLDGFRSAARRLLAEGVEPARLHWHVEGRAAGELALADAPVQPTAAEAPSTCTIASPSAVITDSTSAFASAPAEIAATNPTTAARVPAAFIALCADVVLHRDPQRFGLLYRLLWRLVHEPPLRHDPLDADRLQADGMAKAVRRDIHKMRAFVRFRTVDDGSAEGPLHVAWFEPQHHIVEANAPFFARRFTAMRWALLTPERSVRWDGRTLQFGPGGSRADAPPADAGEALWLTYYQHIFNPARLKLAAMQKEMPRRYWHNLPEAALIAPMAAAANARSDAMIDRAPTLPSRRIVPIKRTSSTSVPVAAATVGEVIDAGPAADADARNDATNATAAKPPADAAGPGAMRGAGGVGFVRDESAADVDAGDPDPGAGAGIVAPAAGGAVGSGRVVVPIAGGDAKAWQTLRERAAGCRECPLGEPATQTVWGEGPIGAALMLVGEQPGDQEDLQGRPFVGPAGRLLARAMAELGWQRPQVYMTNAVKHFKYELRGKRRIHKTPAQREAAACLHWLEEEIDAVAPQAIVALGATAARQLLGRPVAVMRERGQWLTRADGRRVLVTLHPSALLRGEPAEMESAYAAWLADLRQATVTRE